jgi:hypothetical protein
MRKNIFFVPAILAAVIFFTACKKEDGKIEQPEVVSSIGDINADVNAFRATLGSLNTSTGVTGGRREINWDAVPDSFALVDIPKDFFNPTGPGANVQRQRGFSYEINGGFRVSQQGFAELRTGAIGDAQAFSGSKTFANVSSFAWPVGFQVSGQNTKASVKSFGVVFVGVDLANTTFIEPFSGVKSLGKFFAAPHNADSKHSFVGVSFSKNIITSVDIVHGNGLIASADTDISNGGSKDLVMLDDIIYSEPVQQ